MAKIYFIYGTMRSGKSIDVIRTYDSYEKSGRKAIVAKPCIDTRDENVVRTRKGYEIPSMVIKSDSLSEILSIVKFEEVEAIIIDEAQFLNKNQTTVLPYFADVLDIPVFCYGLKTNFRGELFEGSKSLLELADNIEEIKTVCQYCKKKATYNLRLINGKPSSFEEKEIIIGDEEYIQVCRKHFIRNMYK